MYQTIVRSTRPKRAIGDDSRLIVSVVDFVGLRPLEGLQGLAGLAESLAGPREFPRIPNPLGHVAIDIGTVATSPVEA